MLIKYCKVGKGISSVEHYKTRDVKSHFKIFESRELTSTITQYEGEMLNLTSKYLKVENWHLQFYSIQAEMLDNRHNDISMEI